VFVHIILTCSLLPAAAKWLYFLPCVCITLCVRAHNSHLFTLARRCKLAVFLALCMHNIVCSRMYAGHNSHLFTLASGCKMAVFLALGMHVCCVCAFFSYPTSARRYKAAICMHIDVGLYSLLYIYCQRLCFLPCVWCAYSYTRAQWLQLTLCAVQCTNISVYNVL
jgi:hypothetical protein